MSTTTHLVLPRRLFVPAISTFVLLCVLVSLGIWQVERLAWKRGLLADISRAEAAPAIKLPAQATQFEKVEIEGRFRPELAVRYGDELRDTPQGSLIGSQLLVPLERVDAPTVLVDRGWVPENVEPATPPGIVSVSGYVRVAEHPRWFSAPDDPAGRRFFTLDPEAVARALRLGPVMPFTLIVLRAAGDQLGAYPLPAEHLPRPPNDHLSYAITWFGLAIVLLVVFAVYVAKKREPS